MSAPVVAFNRTATAGDVARFLARCPIESAPVVDADGKLIGVIAEQDLIAVAGNHGWAQLPIERMMCRGLPYYPEDTPLRSVAALLERSAAHRIFVVRQGRPVGIVGRREILRHVLRGAGTPQGQSGALGQVGDVARQHLELQVRRLVELAAAPSRLADLLEVDPEQAILLEVLGLLAHFDDSSPPHLRGPQPPVSEGGEGK